MRVSLRIVLGALSAVTVAVVAAVTLSITLTSSVSALRRIGEKHADALLAIAEGETTTLFSKGSDAVMQIVNATQSEAWPSPSESDTTRVFFRGTLGSSFLLGMPDITSIVMYFRDDTSLNFNLEAASSPIYTYTTHVPDFPYNASNPAAIATATSKTVVYDRTTHASHTAPPNETLPTSSIRATRLWQQMSVATFGGFASAVTPLLAMYIEVSTGVQLLEFMPMLSPIYAPGESLLAGHEPFAYAVISFTAQSLGDFLQRTRSTAGTVAFAYDGLGFVFATSNPDLPTRELRPVSSSLPPGCATTAEFASVTTIANLTHHLVCRHPLTEMSHAGLREIASTDRSMLFPSRAAGRSVQRIDAGGEVFYAALVQVPLAFRGLELYLALLVPEADVLGDVITSRNVAIGVTCGLVVLAAVVNFAVVFVLLHPLNDVAARMLRAANFEDEENAVEMSAMTEVAQLQEAYLAMSDELTRIGAYVPQSVLMARKAAQNSDDDETDDTAFDRSDHESSRRDQSDSRSVRSVSSHRSTGSHKSTHGNGVLLTAGAAATSDVALVTRQVSVVSANLVGLHAIPSERLVDEIAAAAEVMDEAVSSRRGALTFHGDRFLATFNAAKPCAGHAVKAASAAVAAAAAHVDRGSRLRLTAGVASGLCTVGPMGSASVKALSTVGASVAAAALLERLAVHGGHGAKHSVLATHRIASEASTSLVVEFVDLVAAPGSENALAVASLQHQGAKRRSSPTATPSGSLTGRVDAPADNEWMYVMAKQTSPFNAVFEELHRGRVAEAASLYAELAQAAELQREASPAASVDENDTAGQPWRLREVMEALSSVDTTDKRAVNAALVSASRRLEFGCVARK